MTIYTEPKTSSWTPERRAAASERMRLRHQTDPRVHNPNPKGRIKGTKNTKPFNRSEANLNRVAKFVQASCDNLQWRRKNHTEETKAKMREWNLGRVMSDEARAKMSTSAIKRIEEIGLPKMAYKGRFRPNNPSKYSGDPTNIVYRSGIELRFMSYLDTNPGVVSWSSEETIVPYFDPSTSKWRRYFPDFLVVVKQGTSTLTQLIEVKPASQCVPPKGTMHQDGRKNRRLLKEQLTYITNQAKFEAATQYALDRNWKFKIVTDKDILGLK